ncbi:MAG: LytTR family DNA-binding domain-containing protein [Lachnospiraceae bacterium]|nr:LytTR family DNA-binding domain-containing protein [Lachnospiraceae bacterium]
MIDIYICEDNTKQLEAITKYVRNTIVIEELDMKISLSTNNPHAVLKKLQSAENPGLFILDIDLHSDIDGLVLAQKIRKIAPRCFIIFITSHSEMCFLTFQYKVEALDFIIKDHPELIQSKIHECLLNVMEKYHNSCDKIIKTFSITLGDHVTTVDLDKILYFETSSNVHRIILHAENRRIEFTSQLKEVEKQLDYRFYRCHRSYIVNKDQISEVNFKTYTIHMKNGDICPLSVRMKKGLKKMLS